MSPKRGVTRTINPLHFEDLEPHRFEDLVRQLAHGFRRWRHLEATGRLGQDQGVDIHGVELADSGERGSDLDAEANPQPSEREWIFQCKREKRVGAADLTRIVAEAVPDSASPPYGLVIAAAADASAKALAAFRTAALSRGVQEAHLWTKAHLEDLLFRPENDHLLFAYFGLSLRARRTARQSEIRADIALRQKILRALDMKSFNERPGRQLDLNVVVRDWESSTYPATRKPPNSLNARDWEVVEPEYFYPEGIVVVRFTATGWVKPDGTWDVDRETVAPVGGTGLLAHLFQENEESSSAIDRRGALLEVIPRAELKFVRFGSYLPFASVVEVDPVGDPRYPGMHLYCRYTGPLGPYTPGTIVLAEDRHLDPAKHVDLISKTIPPNKP